MRVKQGGGVGSYVERPQGWAGWGLRVVLAGIVLGLAPDNVTPRFKL